MIMGARRRFVNSLLRPAADGKVPPSLDDRLRSSAGASTSESPPGGDSTSRRDKKKRSKKKDRRRSHSPSKENLPDAIDWSEVTAVAFHDERLLKIIGAAAAAAAPTTTT